MKPVIFQPSLGEAEAHLYYGINVVEGLRLLPSDSVQTICTSPPYWGLRDYGTTPYVWGGDPECDHVFDLKKADHVRSNPGGEGINRDRGFDELCESEQGFCQKCPAWNGQLGLEPTPELFVDHIVWIFEEARRVLRPDGTLWINLGDSYSRGTRGNVPTQRGQLANVHDEERYDSTSPAAQMGDHPEIKGKDLVGIPWMVAFALRKAGWYLRRDIVWAKGSCMPESVRDRPTTAHEYVFLFAHPESKGRYFYDADAIKEPHKLNRWGKTLHKDTSVVGEVYDDKVGESSLLRKGATNFHPEGGRNKRSVWHINPRGYPGAHFATWPPKLVEPMIKAGCPEGGTVLDPFSGSATTGMVALGLDRNYIGIDLNPDYLDLARARLEERAAPVAEDPDESNPIFDLFGNGGDDEE